MIWSFLRNRRLQQVQVGHTAAMRRLTSPTAIEATIAEADVEEKGVVSLIPWWRKSSMLVLVTDGDKLLLIRVVSLRSKEHSITSSALF